MSLSLHKSASMQLIHPVYNKMHKIWIQTTTIQYRPMHTMLTFETKFKKHPTCINIHPCSFPREILYAFLFTSMCATFPAHLILVELSHCNYIWQRVKVMKLLIMEFSPTPYQIISLWSKFLLTTLFSNHSHTHTHTHTHTHAHAHVLCSTLNMLNSSHLDH
jgi:hypothetical protein